MTPRSARTVLAWLLYAMGGLAATAVVPAVMPTRWIMVVNDHLGLAPLSDTPLTQYLARSLSVLYSLLGLLTLYLARRLERYVELIAVLGWLTVLLGFALTALDFAVGMPAPWSWGEGPPTVVLGGAFVWLSRRAAASRAGPWSNPTDR